ncbi:MAG: O-antigen ligase family protein [Melioribacteraceae bacterium]
MYEIADNNSEFLTLRKILIGIFFFIQIFVLTFVAFEYYKIAIILSGAIFGTFLLYIFFNEPFFALPTLLLSILAGTIGDSQNGNQYASFADILFPVLIGIYLIRILFSEKENTSKFNFIKIFYTVFLVWALFTVLVAVNKILVIAYWRNYFGGFIVFLFGITFIKNYIHVKIFIWTLIIWGIILAFIEFNIFLSLGDIQTALVKIFFNKNLISISWGRSNYLAAFFVLIIPITLGYLLSSKSKHIKSILTIALLIMFTAVIITLSRGGMLSLGIALIIFISRILKPKTFIPLIGLVILITIILLLNPLTFILIKGISSIDSNLSTYTRLNFYEDVWRTFLMNPITGVGLANLGYFSKFTVTTAAASAHNIILGTLGETGIIGSVAFLGMLTYAFILSYKNFRKEKIERISLLLWSFFSAFAGVLIHSMMEPNFEGFQFGVMFWATFATFLKLSELKNEEKLILVNGPTALNKINQ